MAQVRSAAATAGTMVSDGPIASRPRGATARTAYLVEAWLWSRMAVDWALRQAAGDRYEAGDYRDAAAWEMGRRAELGG